MILYEYDCNAILQEVMKSRTTSKISREYQVLHARLYARGCKSKFQRLDNEAPKKLK